MNSCGEANNIFEQTGWYFRTSHKCMKKITDNYSGIILYLYGYMIHP